MAITERTAESTNAYRCPKCGREVLTCCLRLWITPITSAIEAAAKEIYEDYSLDDAEDRDHIAAIISKHLSAKE